MSVASRDSWKILPPPAKREPLGFEGCFSEQDAKKMMLGIVPRQMEDKWFIYFHEAWLYFHRSWTGACIYAVRLDGLEAGVRVSDSWVNRDSDQYKSVDLEYDRELVAFLIDALLLEKAAQFPRPSDQPQTMPGVFQHHIVGRAYPEAVHRAHSARNGFWQRVLQLFRKRKTRDRGQTMGSGS